MSFEELKEKLLIAFMLAFPNSQALLKNIPHLEKIIAASQHYKLEDKSAEFFSGALFEKEKLFGQIMAAHAFIHLAEPAVMLAIQGYSKPLFALLDHNKSCQFDERITINVSTLPTLLLSAKFLEFVASFFLVTKAAMSEIPRIEAILLVMAANQGIKPLAAIALLFEGSDINAADSTGKTALHWAAFCGHSRLIEFLIGYGANIQAKTRNGSTPLHCAVHENKIAAVKVLLDAGANPNAQDNAGEAPIHLAAEFGMEVIFKMLLEKDGNIFLTTHKGFSVLALTKRTTVHRKCLLLTLFKYDGPALSTFIDAEDIKLIKELFTSRVAVSHAQILDLAHLSIIHHDWELLNLIQIKNIILVSIEQQTAEVIKLLLVAGIQLNQRQIIQLTRLAFTSNDRGLLGLLQQQDSIKVTNVRAISRDRRDTYKSDYHWYFFQQMQRGNTPLNITEYLQAKLFFKSASLENDIYRAEYEVFQQYYALSHKFNY